MHEHGDDKLSNDRATSREAQGIESQSAKKASVSPTPTRGRLVAGVLVLVVILVCDVVRDAAHSQRGDLVSSGALKVDINTAGMEDLMLLPGIGPARAADILEERRAGGAFESLDDLARIDGISEQTVQKLRGFAVCSWSADVSTP